MVVRALIPQFERFHDLVIPCELRMANPDPEFFQVALARTGLRAEETAYFDDILLFVKTASALGIQARVFTDAPTFRTQLAELGFVV